MKKYLYTLYILFVLCVVRMGAQNPYRTVINNQQIKSLQIKVSGESISVPVIELNGNKQMEIKFDVLGGGYSRYTYSVIHCNADWMPSSMSQLEYMDGFQGMAIDDFRSSSATTTPYINYRLLLPNDDMRFKLSGNYAVNVYDDDNPDEVLFTACFFVVEPIVDIAATVSGNTAIDMNRTHQQVNLSINHRNLPIPHPATDLQVHVYQNNRWDNMVANSKPSVILQNQVVYKNVRELIFDAGNEYRRMEFLSNQYNGMGIADIQFHNPYYHVVLHPDLSRTNRAYQYDQDQNGRFFVHCSNCINPDNEADYYIAHFTLAEELLPGGNVYLNGDFLCNNFHEDNRMEYNRETGQYEKYMLLKQGNYNYQYLFVPSGEYKGQTGPVEGDHFETENEYTIAVYYRPIGTRYDRLVGATTVNTK